MTSEPLPSRFESWTRIWLPPSDTWATCRMTLLASAIGGALLELVST